MFLPHEDKYIPVGQDPPILFDKDVGNLVEQEHIYLFTGNVCTPAEQDHMHARRARILVFFTNNSESILVAPG